MVISNRVGKRRLSRKRGRHAEDLSQRLMGLLGDCTIPIARRPIQNKHRVLPLLSLKITDFLPFYSFFWVDQF